MKKKFYSIFGFVLLILTIILLTTIYLKHDNETVESITLKIKSIDSFTKEPRVADVIEVRKIRKPSFSIMKQSLVFSEKITDSLGIASFEFDVNGSYIILIFGPEKTFGSTEFDVTDKNNNEIIEIKVTPSKKSIYPFLH